MSELHNKLSISNLLIGLIRLYQLTLWPFFSGACRFYPSCSAYFIEAIRQQGAFKGLALGICRLGKCHPFHPGGYDPVPLKKRD